MRQDAYKQTVGHKFDTNYTGTYLAIPAMIKCVKILECVKVTHHFFGDRVGEH